MPVDIHSRPIIGVGVLVWRQKKILLGERLSADPESAACWQLPGGHLEVNETVIECAAREVFEETGLKVKKLRHLGFTDQTFPVAEKKYLTLLVSCEYDSGEAQVLEPDKCASWQWFDYRQLPRPLFRPISLYLTQLSAGGADLYAAHIASTPVSGTP